LDDANENLALARQVVNNYVLAVTDDLRLRGEDLRPLRRQLLERAVPFYESAAARYQGLQEVQREQGETYLQLARICDELGDHDRAGEMFNAAVAAANAATERWRDDSATQFLRCQVLQESGSHHLKAGRYEQARIQFELACESLAQLIEQFPNSAEYRRRLALTQLHWGTMDLFAMKSRDAEQRLTAAATSFDRLIADDPDNDELRSLLISTYNNLGLLNINRQRWKIAIDWLNQCSNHFDSISIAAAHPTIAGVYASAMGNRGMANGMLERRNEASADFARALAAIDSAVTAQPSSATLHGVQLTTRQNYGEFLTKTGQWEAAETEFSRALEDAAFFRHQAVTRPETKFRIARVERFLADVYRQTGRDELADKKYRELVDRFRGIVAEETSRPHFQFEYDSVVSDLAKRLAAAGNSDEAAVLIETEIAQLSELAEKNPTAHSLNMVLSHFREVHDTIQKNHLH
jgi:tetratricopeptide (TPR) repeat protein